MSESTGRTSFFAAGGSVLTAVLASACCWLPVLLVSFGLSAAGVSAGFEKWRPVFLTATAAFLGLGFYLAYFRKAKCAPGSACAVPNPKFRRLNRSMLWVATIVVLAFALFPNYASSLLGASGEPTPSAARGEMVVVGISGMTCEACTIHVQRELSKVPGVLDVSVSYADKHAVVTIDSASSVPSGESLARAVEKAGYTAILDKN